MFVPKQLLLAAVLLAAGLPLAAAASKPNLLVILADDIGFSDLGCMGGEIQTPNLDALAANGLRFTQFYNTSRCCPTRASLLTGLYPHQAGLGHMMVDRNLPGYRSNLNRSNVTIAEVLRTAGYRTYMCGKWHVTNRDGANDDNTNWPVQRGFERFYGTIRGYGSFFDPASLCRQNTFITPVNDPEYQPKEYFYTDALSDNAVRYLREHQEQTPGQPFFLYLAYTAAHWPMHALDQDIAKYRGKYDGGYAPIQRARLERLARLGLLPAHWQPAPLTGDWAAQTRKEWEARCMEVFAAMIDNMDQGIGRVIDELKRSGRLEDTVILYLNDNGACAEVMGRQERKSPATAGLKPLGRDELQDRIRLPMQTRDGRAVRNGAGVMPGPADTYLAYGPHWSNVSNTPFREHKHWVHEGGISTPLIVHWPKGVPAQRRGQLEHQPGHLIDLMATAVALSGATYPAQHHGEAILPMEGISLLPAFAGQPLRRTQPLFWEHESNRAVREGKWKLVAKENQPWELYDMEQDRTEMNNLAAKEPRRVKELAAKWDIWAARANVLPLGGWKAPPAK